MLKTIEFANANGTTVDNCFAFIHLSSLYSESVSPESIFFCSACFLIIFSPVFSASKREIRVWAALGVFFAFFGPMTYMEDDNSDGELVPELTLRMEGDDTRNGDYLKLRGGSEVEEGVCVNEVGEESSSSKWTGFLWYWLKLVFLFAVLAVLAGVFLKWVGPYFMDKDIIPIINWERKTFCAPVLAVLVFGSIALFPTLLLPSSPSMWVAGITFGYGFGFLLIISGAAVGVSLPYFIGSLFLHKLQGWLAKYPKRAAILRAAGEGNWFNQFRAVTLIRISPFPYIIYNYCAVATNLKYGPYILGSLVGMVPEIFLAMYTGILIWTLADASHGQHSFSATQIMLNIFGFLATVATTIIITAYAKRKLKELQHDDDELLLQ